MPITLTITADTTFADLAPVIECIQRGGLIIFPTDTLYGIGCDAFNEYAVRELAFAKRRPADKPFPVIVPSFDDVLRVAHDVSEDARKLTEAFWPGGLTIVVPKHPDLPTITTGGAETVGVRMPNDRIAIALMKLSGKLLSAPSANVSDEPPPASCADLSPAIIACADYVIDNGPRRGMASTVVDMTAPPYRLIREGAVTREAIANALEGTPQVC